MYPKYITIEITDTMKRHKAGVKFHDPNQKANVTSPENVPTVDVTDHDPKVLRTSMSIKNP